MTLTLRQVRRTLDQAWPPGLAASWDTGIGLTCGDPDASVDTVLLAVDVDDVTVDEAVRSGAQLLLTHHPLLFRAVQSVAADTPKGRLLHRMIAAGVAHVAAHTNADKAVEGVNVGLARALGLQDHRPLVPDAPPTFDKVVTFVPTDHTQALIGALAAAGAGTIGDYAEAAFVGTGTGQFRPLPGANPTIGQVGTTEFVPEDRVEMVLPRSARTAVLRALLATHPYEEPAFDLLELAPTGRADTGSARIGTLPEPLSLREFAQLAADHLPATVTGARWAGDGDRTVRTVAVCGGSGFSYAGQAAAAGADVYLTSDVSHHEAAEFVAEPGNPALVEVSHWAAEWTWLPLAAQVLQTAHPELRVIVSTLRTDPWGGRAAPRT